MFHYYREDEPRIRRLQPCPNYERLNPSGRPLPQQCIHCSKEQKSILEFIEPHPTGGTCYVRISKEQAIAWQKRKWPQATDEEALEDFKTIHWAYEV